MIKYDSNELEKIQKRFPNLYFVEDDKTIRGELNFCDHYKNVGCNDIDEWIIESCDSSTDDCVEDVYSIEINFNKEDTLNKFPKVFETDKRIENLATSLKKPLKDLHINDDKSCCVGIFSPSDRLLLYDFVIKRVYPYFVWQAYFDKYNEVPPCGELPHDWRQAILIRITDEENNIKLVNSKQKGNPTGNNRNKPCPCDSGKKYKKCCLNSDKEADSKIKEGEAILSYFKKIETQDNPKKC